MFNLNQIKKTKKIVAKHKLKKMIPIYLCVLIAIMCICMEHAYSAFNTNLIAQGSVTATGERGETIETIALTNFYIFLFVNGTQIEYENSNFWGAFEVASARQDTDDTTFFYIPLEQLQTIYSTYVGGTLNIGNGGNATITYAPNAYNPTDNLTECTYPTIYYIKYAKIQDTTGLDPHRINLYVTTQ